MMRGEWDDGQQPDVLDEATETWGPGSDEPVPFLPVDLDPALLIDWHTRSLVLSDEALATTLNAWSRAAAGHPYVDHTTCEGDGCDRVICACPLSSVGVMCEGTTEQACPHHSMLCDECRLACVECRVDYRDDAEAL